MKVTNTILGRMQSTSICDNCSGTGKIVSNRPPGSDINGQILNEETVEVKIPAGVEDGMQLRVAGKGNDAISDGIPGDLLVLINELDDDNLKREVEIDMTLTAPGCGMGDILVEDAIEKVEIIPTIHNVKVELVFDPPWSQDMMSDEAKLQTGMMY